MSQESILTAITLGDKLKSPSRSGFLYVGTTDIGMGGWIILGCGSRLVHCRLLSSIPALRPPEASSNSKLQWPKMSPDIVKRPLGTSRICKMGMQTEPAS